METLAEKLSSPLPSQEGERSCFNGSEIIDFGSFYDVSIELWKYTDSVPFFVDHFILNYYYNDHDDPFVDNQMIIHERVVVVVIVW